MKELKILLVVVLVGVLSGCAIPVDRYHASADNQNIIKAQDRKFKVADFTATTTDYKVMCRLANNVELSDGLSFQEYIEQALIEELKMASAYSEKEGVLIKGHLNDTDVSSGMTDAHWTLDLTVSNAQGESFQVKHKREFDASFVGGIACGSDMPKAFAPTVKELIYKIFNHPQFDELFLK
ncbi:hypothetical protein [Pseudidiomarina sp. CB1]|uniref:hypothetical protein n=1 Tax=Pseudidiomarina sp. CB1 TaxID=2972484 RepID=UPI002162E0B2|nr:hypothetical protein [Pseudidiomarina sp. CB1]